MIDALAISNVILWAVVLALLVAVFALARQVGILYERVAPMGALMIDSGPAVGAHAADEECRADDRLHDQPRREVRADTRVVHVFEEVQPGLSKGLYEVVAKSMRLKPDDRYTTASEMREALEHAGSEPLE